MRQPFNPQPDLNVIPIEKILLPLKSRDELPPILAGLQWIWTPPTLQHKIFALLEEKIVAGKKAPGRPGMELGQILVLGVVRLGLDTNWDRLEPLANYDTLLRQMLGVEQNPWGAEAQLFNHQTLRDTGALVDEQLLPQINALVAASGREGFRKKESAPVEALALKVDPDVLDPDVPFPPDLNLLWDAGRKCVDLIEKDRDQFGYALPHWRKAKDWRRRLKALERITGKAVFGGGANKEARVRPAVREYWEVGRELSVKVSASLPGLCEQAVRAEPWEGLAYFHRMLDKPLDLVDRRLLREEKIPAAEKIFSLFEPHPEWIAKGKQRPTVELGPRLLGATEQQHLIQDYDVPLGQVDVDQSVAVAEGVIKSGWRLVP